MISVATRADTDLVTKTHVLRASADELAIRVDEQTAEMNRLRSAIERLKADHQAHITATIARMSSIDGELEKLAAERTQTEKDTAAAIRQVEGVRRDVVTLGAKLAKEFILLPPAVARYPRLDKLATEEEDIMLRSRAAAAAAVASSSSSSAAAAASVAAGSGGIGGGASDALALARSTAREYRDRYRGTQQWYTDGVPAANLQCVDMTISAAVAALDGKITDDAEFRAELEAARSESNGDSDSIFSKESLIKSVAASSPMRRRRASLLLLSQASAALAQQSATIDDLTRHPHRWSEADRLLAVKAAQTQDLMIRDVVRELCKNAPVPRAAERQLLTALNMHTMSTAPVGVKRAHFADDVEVDGAAAGDGVMLSPGGETYTIRGISVDASPQQQKRGSVSPTSVRGGGAGGSVSARRTAGASSASAAQSARSTRIGGGRVNVTTDALAESALEHAAAARGTGRDPLLRRLQAELEDEQEVMTLRSHAARVRAWQELDLKRAARERMVPLSSPVSQHELSPVQSDASTYALKKHRVSSPVQSTMMSVSGTAATSASASSPPHRALPTSSSVFSMLMNSANVLTSPPLQSNAKQDQPSPVKTSTAFGISAEGLDETRPTAKAAAPPVYAPPPPVVVHRSTGLLVRPTQHTIVTASPPPAHIAEFEGGADILDQANRALQASRERQRERDAAAATQRAQQERDARTTQTVRPPRPPSVMSGIADPETAVDAITMRRTGRLETPLSFVSEQRQAQLDKAAARAGVGRPSSATAAPETARRGGSAGGSRFRWKTERVGQAFAEEIRRDAAAAATSGVD